MYLPVNGSFGHMPEPASPMPSEAERMTKAAHRHDKQGIVARVVRFSAFGMIVCAATLLG